MLEASLLFQIPTAFYFALFLLCRISYNVGLGLQLRWKWFMDPMEQLPNVFPSILRYSFLKSAPTKLSIDRIVLQSPPLRRWFAFRLLAGPILALDLVSYFVLVLAVSKTSEVPSVLQLCVGLCLIALAILVKTSADSRLGPYGWFMGDFFFVRTRKLESSGIFSWCPHPMYTLGYLHYYGFCVLFPDSWLILVSLFAHSMQLWYLFAVELPHMRQLYSL
jgi:phosphatidylethanolamine N-methyltransferase